MRSLKGVNTRRYRVLSHETSSLAVPLADNNSCSCCRVAVDLCQTPKPLDPLDADCRTSNGRMEPYFECRGDRAVVSVRLCKIEEFWLAFTGPFRRRILELPVDSSCVPR